MLEIARKVVGEYQSNSFILAASGREEAILIDPGADPADLLQWIEPYGVSKILITHGHDDHVGALDDVRTALDIEVGIHPADVEQFGLTSDFNIESGSLIPIGDAKLEVFHVPGHTPGSVVFLIRENDNPPRAIVGDAIFPGGPGYTATPEDLLTALASLQQTVFQWSDEVVLIPGHGAETTVGAERAAFEVFIKGPLPPELCGDVLWR